ncbi:hypothetical protein M3916_000926 [Vibrio parahaemolyticus]|uniref:hypothetical protein n=2 Tax=Vibrio parahaemolyticus TaxID=670 RepID=UPI002405AD36|nr:hypothetical protein [Vibrio parahaemolyticus]EIA1588594.1 hypothetical protein [Vibrio parahaemolyticus]EIZ0308071.1 hypothetical protein [Vibrio parahaemolyticus]EIZ1336597.1 hypothetical protein [Vibrio parahaemolyticus]EJE4160853.1 hypothetical protein [Vibrio parahaemolyticus]
MVSNETKDTVHELNQLHGFKVDDWFLSSGRCGEVEVHCPYKTADEACKEAKAKYGVGTANLLTLKFALYLLMLNAIAYASPIKCLSFEGLFNEVSRND